MADIENMSVEEIKRGYRYYSENEEYVCLVCQRTFQQGEIYRIEDRFFEARLAVKEHVKSHGKRLDALLGQDSRYITLTDNQKELLLMMGEGEPDNEIARKMAVTPATVRRQRFSLREKAKQAKMYLAIYELASNRKDGKEQELISVHGGATMIDERYVITEQERDKILRISFESLAPLRLKMLSAKEKKKVVVLTKIAEQFEKGRIYTGKETDQILREIYDDYVTLRRYLIEYGFMDRKADGSQYWLKD